MRLAIIVGRCLHAHALMIHHGRAHTLGERGRPAAISPTVLETVLVALIDNARQAEAREVRLGGRSDEEAIMLNIADDDPDIPVADRERIFESFFTSRRAAGGTGLGLPIVRSLLLSAGSTIKLGETKFGSRSSCVCDRLSSHLFRSLDRALLSPRDGNFRDQRFSCQTTGIGRFC
jgi:signal transduction histidine kinase